MPRSPRAPRAVAIARAAVPPALEYALWAALSMLAVAIGLSLVLH